MTGVEIDFVVKDSKEALDFYRGIFELEETNVTDFENGLNEAFFSIYGTKFHILDENHDYMLFAPKEGETKSFWFNIIVSDIKETFDKAIKMGCSVIQPLTEIETHNAMNAMFADKFGYIWLLHEFKLNS